MSEGIVYQNKDIEFKLLSETYKERSFEAYGLNLPRIKEVLPTNLPSVSANEKRLDNLFLLEDGTYAVVDYESEDKVENRIKYVNYIGRVMERYYKDGKGIPDIRLIVIYTGDVEKAEGLFQIKSLTLQMEQVFVQKLPVEKICRTVDKKLKNKEKLTEKELMQLIIAPLAEKGQERKQKRIEQVIELAKSIDDENEQKFVFSGLLTASDKFISKRNAEKIRSEFIMTKIGKMIFEDGVETGREEGREEGRLYTAEKMLKKNYAVEEIMEITNLTKEEIEEIEKKLFEIV